MSLHLRDVTEADLPEVLSLRNRAFGPLTTGDGGTWWERVAAETLGGRWLAVADESGALVGAGRIRPYEQAWGGQLLRMGGVAGVYVEPSARGQGVATALTRGLITRMGELGDVVSCLFPTTVEPLSPLGLRGGRGATAHDVCRPHPSRPRLPRVAAGRTSPSATAAISPSATVSAVGAVGVDTAPTTPGPTRGRRGRSTGCCATTPSVTGRSGPMPPTHRPAARHDRARRAHHLRRARRASSSTTSRARPSRSSTSSPRHSEAAPDPLGPGGLGLGGRADRAHLPRPP